MAEIQRAFLQFLTLQIFQTLTIASAKSQIARGASHQPAFMNSCLLVTRVVPVYLLDELVLGVL